MRSLISFPLPKELLGAWRNSQREALRLCADFQAGPEQVLRKRSAFGAIRAGEKVKEEEKEKEKGEKEKASQKILS